MATLTGSTLRTVRFYEEAGILSPDRRSAGGHRLYGPQQLERLQLITDLRATGMSLDEIRELLETRAAATTGRQAATEVTAAIEPRLAELDRKIEALNRLKGDLQQTREILNACKACPHRKGFPANCRTCDRLEPVGELPPSFRVLWWLDA